MRKDKTFLGMWRSLTLPNKTIEYCFVRGSTVGALRTRRQNLSRDVAQFGSAPRLGRGGRTFKSCHPDHFKRTVGKRFFFCLFIGLYRKPVNLYAYTKNQVTTRLSGMVHQYIQKIFKKFLIFEGIRKNPNYKKLQNIK